MRKRLNKFAQMAGIMLALVFTFSCSADKDDDNSGGSGGGGSTFKDDRDGKSYKYVKIGDQTWMAENLNYRGTEPDTLGSCYGDDPTNCRTYGRLYSWATANTVCPLGWRLPSQDEWQELEDFVGSDVAGKKLKAKNGWNDYRGETGNGTDNYDFSALPGGVSSSTYPIGYYGYWWTSSENSNATNYACARAMRSEKEYVNHYNESKSIPFSIRCIKDN